MYKSTLLSALCAVLWQHRTPGSRTVKMAYCVHNRLSNAHFKQSRKLNRKTFPSTYWWGPTNTNIEFAWSPVNPPAAFQRCLYIMALQLTACSVASCGTEGVEILENTTVLGVYVEQCGYRCDIIWTAVMCIKIRCPNIMFGWGLIVVFSPKCVCSLRFR